MAARVVLFRRLWKYPFLFRLRTTSYCQGINFLKVKRYESYLNSLFVRSLCGQTVNTFDVTSAAKKSEDLPVKKLKYQLGKLCKNQNFSAARELLDSILEEHGFNENFTSTFNCFLHYVVKCEEREYVSYLLDQMAKYNVKRDRATYSVLALYYSNEGLLEQGINVLKKMNVEGIRCSSRNYQPLIAMAARLGHLDTAFSLYEKMRLNNKDNHQCSVPLIHGVLNSSDSVVWRSKVLGILNNFRADRIMLNTKTLEAVAEWFRSEAQSQWKVTWSTIISGACQSCGLTLETGKLSGYENVVLEQHLTQHLWNTMRGYKTKSYTSIGDFADIHYPEVGHHLPYSLEKYIAETGPYDVIIDALNVGYYGGKGQFDVNKVQETVKYFQHDGKRVLVIGAPPMSFELLMKTNPTQAPSLADIKYDECGLYLIRVRLGKIAPKLGVSDDLYLLLAAVHCGLDTLLVSNDLFQDHLHKLPVNVQALLGRWLRSNQVLLTRLPNDDKVVYKRHTAGDPVVQNTTDTWHFPSDTEGKWLCVQRK